MKLPRICNKTLTVTMILFPLLFSENIMTDIISRLFEANQTLALEMIVSSLNTEEFLKVAFEVCESWRHICIDQNRPLISFYIKQHYAESASFRKKIDFFSKKIDNVKKCSYFKESTFFAETLHCYFSAILQYYHNLNLTRRKALDHGKSYH